MSAKERKAKESKAKERQLKERSAKERKDKIRKERAMKEAAHKEKIRQEKLRKEKRIKEKKAKARERKGKKHIKNVNARKKHYIKVGIKCAKHAVKAARAANTDKKARRAVTAHERKGKKHIKNVKSRKKHYVSVGIKCAKHAVKAAQAANNSKKHRRAVKKSVKDAKVICKREKDRRAKALERKAKMAIKGPTFNFKSSPCKGGKGKFTMKLKHNQRVNVGLIPANQYNVKIQLRTDKDVDAELWTAPQKREIAIVAWMVGKINSPTKASIKWGGGTINYSGYNGITNHKGMNFGHEDISIDGKVNHAFMMRAYAFEAGVARITYSWGVDPQRCAAAKAKKRKEAKAKHDAKRALRKKMNEGKYKQAMKVLKGGKGCKGAKVWVKTTIAHHAKAKVHLGKMVKALKKCHIGKKTAYQLYKGSKHFERKVKVWEKNTRSHHAKTKAHLGKMVKALKKCHIGKKNAYKVYKLAKHDEKKFKKGVIRRKIIRSKKAPAVYQHCNFGGYKKVLHHSTNWVKKLGIRNDDLSSIKVPAGKCVILYQHIHYRGKSWKICGKTEVKCFVHHKMLGGKSWNDQVSSIRVIKK